jgi:hypothetical protein
MTKEELFNACIRDLTSRQGKTLSEAYDIMSEGAAGTLFADLIAKRRPAQTSAARVSMIPTGKSFPDGSLEYIAPNEFDGLEISRASGSLCTGETARLHEVYPAPELLLVKRTSGGVPFWVCSTIFYS